ncbi:MAG: A24 family peptidase [Pirellulaceae bacterium]
MTNPGMIIGMALLGLALGTQVNRAIYGLAWKPRPIGPWRTPAQEAAGRHWSDYLPVIGWLGLRRESVLHGPGYWVRPALVELAMVACFAGIGYWVSTDRVLPAGTLEASDWSTVVLPRLVTWCGLLVLLTVATFIDLDEQTIPDQVTISGTLLALVLAAVFPLSRMPVVLDGSVQPLLVTTPGLDPPWLFGIRGLLYALAIHGLWCMALMPKTCTCRHGVGKGIRYMFASMIRPARRSRTTRDRWPRPAATRLAVVAIVGWLGILLVWWLSGIYWHGLLTALVGLAGGGLVVWTVRLVSRWSLGREAMGFGDVTLLAMIGAFIGWQAAVLVFFLAPLAGVVVGLLQLVTTRRTEMAFGPYLCLATVGVMLAWPALWYGYAADVFAMGWVIPGLFAAGVCLMGGMLFTWSLIRGAGASS